MIHLWDFEAGDLDSLQILLLGPKEPTSALARLGNESEPTNHTCRSKAFVFRPAHKPSSGCIPCSNCFDRYEGIQAP